MSGGKIHGGKGKSSGEGVALRAQSSSARAGLQFPVGRIKRYLKRSASGKARVGSKAAIYLTAVLEYLTAEVLDTLIRATIASGGVLPHINKALLLKVEKRNSKHKN